MGTSHPFWIHTDIHGYVDLHESHHRFNLQVEAIEAKAKDAVPMAGKPPTLNVQAVQGLQGKLVQKSSTKNQTSDLTVFFRLQQLADAGGC